MKNVIISKLGKEWYESNININIKNLFEKKIPFSFSSNYQQVLLSRNKIKNLTIKKDINFKTYRDDIEQEQSSEQMSEQLGGDDTYNDDNIDEIIKKEDDDEDQELETIEDLDDEVIEDFNLDELMKLYSMTDIENNKEIKETSKLISQAINDKNWEKNVSKIELSYDNSMDNNNYDSVYDQVFNKIYVTNQYIFTDDTVKILEIKFQPLLR